MVKLILIFANLLLFSTITKAQDSSISKNNKAKVDSTFIKDKLVVYKGKIPNYILNRELGDESLFSSFDNGAADAQTTPVVMPSPTSAAMTNMISDNIDLYTGIGSVTLPLYNLKCNSIELPVAIHSNLNAHKVNDIGTSIGLGWNLSAGGAITRVMKNLPDEFTGWISSDFPFPGYGYTKLIPEIGLLDGFENFDQSVQRPIIRKGNWNVKTYPPDKGYDLQPDEFYFQFGSYSGKFVFDQQGNIHLIPQANFKITPSYAIINDNNKITGFSIKTTDGFTYSFGNYSYNAVEESQLKTNSKSIAYTYRALSSRLYAQCIDNGTGDWDNNYLLYFDNNGKLFVPYERYPYVLGDHPPIGGSTGVTDIIATNTKTIDVPENNQDVVYNSYPSTWLLTSIVSPNNDWINFSYLNNGEITYLANRTFQASVPNLHEIPQNYGEAFFAPLESLAPIRDPARKAYWLPVNHFFSISTSNIVLKSKKLASILTSEGNSVNFHYNTNRLDFPNDKRLDYFSVVNSQGVIVKTVDFGYENQYNSAEPEKFKFSFFRTNYHYVQNQQGFFNHECTTPVYGTDERNFDVPEYCRYRMFLKSITETKGQGFSLPPYLIEYDNSAVLPYRTSTEQDYFGFANENPTRHPFVGISYNSMSGITSPRFSSPLLYFQTTNNISPIPAWPNSSTQGNKNYSIPKMKAGTIKRITYPTGGFKEYLYDFNGITSTGWNGLKITEVKEQESSSATPISKYYSYGEYKQTDYPVLNYSMEEAFYESSNIVIPDSRRYFYSSTRVNSENLTKGTVGGYTYGEVSQPGNGNQKVTYHTTADVDDLANITTFKTSCSNLTILLSQILTYPFPEKDRFDWMRGLPKSEEVRSEAGNKVKETLYSYNFDALNEYGTKDIISITGTQYKIKGVSNCNGVTFNYWDWSLYGKNIIKSKWYTNSSKTERIYDENGVNFSENKTEFTYSKYSFDNKDYLFPTLIKNLKNSRNFTTTTRIKYSLDYILGSPPFTDDFVKGISMLKSKNIFNAPIEKFTFQTDLNNSTNIKYLSGILNKYHADKPLLKEIYKLKTDGRVNSFNESYINANVFFKDIKYKSEINFPLYDYLGRLLQQNKTSNISESYIWDYQKMYPVAKVTNATFSDIAYTSFEADGNGNWQYDESNVISTNSFSGKKSILFNAGSTANIQSGDLDPNKKYTLSFWSRNGTPTVTRKGSDGSNYVISYSGLPAKKIIGEWRFDILNITDAVQLTLGNANIDELRLHPSDAFMNTYTFDPLIGMTGEIDAAGKQTFYEYDRFNRLSIVRNENKDIVKTICYNYASQPVICSTNVCPAPVINSVERDHLTVKLEFTAPANSTNCRIQITMFDPIDPPILWFVNPDGCNSPRTITLPQLVANYRIEVVSYSVDCPNGTWSLPVDF